MNKSNKDSKFDPDELTAPLYEDGEKPKFDTGLKIIIGSVISLLIMGALFFVFADKIKQWTDKHHHTNHQGTTPHSSPSETAPDQSDKILDSAEEPASAKPKSNDNKNDDSKEEEDTHHEEVTPTDHHHHDSETDHTHHPDGWNE